VTLKKRVYNMGYKKQGAKHRVIVIQKEKRPGCLFGQKLAIPVTVYCKFGVESRLQHGDAHV
jgi:hypothetical protein